MHQYTNSMSLCYGELLCTKNRFWLDWYVGLGIRFINATNKLGPQEKTYYYHDWTTNTFYVPDTQTGYQVYPTLALGLKLSYKFF
jgi:hypothetical protein